jgi:hypothetical protein
MFMKETSKEVKVLLITLSALKSGNLILSLHAEEQMAVREISYFDVEEALYRGQREDAKDDYRQNPRSKKWSWRYSIRGKNDSVAKDLRIVVALDISKVVE